MLVTKQWVEENYNKFNNELFGGLLPHIEFKVNRSKNFWGFAQFKYDYKNNTIIPLCITISNYYDSPEKVKLNTLIHEMIHIADYTFHPEHYIRYGKRISGHQYDAHGYWFKAEAKRIEKLGWKITEHITKEEQKVSKLSDRSKECLARKKDVALVCVLWGTTGTNFYFKTDIHKAKMITKTVKKYKFYYIGDVKKIEFYTFEDDELASGRSCGKKLSGWHLDDKKMLKKLKSIKAKQIKIK